MSDRKIHSANYEMSRAITRDLSLLERAGIFTLFFANGVLLWHLPGLIGLVAGGGMFAFVALLVVGELWRQFWRVV